MGALEAVRIGGIAVAAVLLGACSGVIGGDPGGSGPGDPGARPEPDWAGADGGHDGALSEECGEIAPAAMVFANSCAVSGACHLPGGQYPDLSRGALADLVNAASEDTPGETLIVPGDPEASWLYRKMTGTQGPEGGLLMPIGSAEPIDGVATIEAWIRDGAPTECPGEPPGPEIPQDPNVLDQAELFTCVTPSASSPARIRRVNREDWTHSTGYWSGAQAGDNPLHTPAGTYSTYSTDVSIDPATLDLYMLVLPEAAKVWATRDPGSRLRKVQFYSDGELRCIFNDVAPDDACIDYYLERLFRAGVFFRSPSPDEHDRVRAFLVEGLAAEEGDVSQRNATLRHVVSAAWLMSGALFRPDLGEPVENDPEGRRRLTNDELSLALGAVLSTHPPGSGLPIHIDMQLEPDRAAPEDGWLGQVYRASLDGSIHDPAVRRRLLRTYSGGVDEARADLQLDNDSRRTPSRGEYWLAPRLAGFFREWLDYGNAESTFKDSPAATSPWEGSFVAEAGFRNLQRGYYGKESTLIPQLDDTIARAVLRAEAAGRDVYRELLTTRIWRLASNLAYTNGVSCESNDDCTDETYYRCETEVGLCANAISNALVASHRVYGLEENVPATQEGRWVEMDPTKRAGVLTHPAWLAAHGGNFEDDASAVIRGRWIREHLYCQTVPGLDLVRVEAQLIPSDPELRARDRIRQSIEEGPGSETCMGCHRLMNSLGMPFEIYNHAGFPRALDHGLPPDGHSVIDVAPDPSLMGEVNDALELSQMLADSSYARRCFIRHVFRYFMGRDETKGDACTLAAMEEAFEGGSFIAMLEALVTADTFVYRHVPEEAP